MPRSITTNNRIGLLLVVGLALVLTGVGCESMSEKPRNRSTGNSPQGGSPSDTGVKEKADHPNRSNDSGENINQAPENQPPTVPTIGGLSIPRHDLVGMSPDAIGQILRAQGQYSEEVVIRVMRNHLDDVVRRAPKAIVYGYVMPKRQLTPAEFVEMYNEYGFFSEPGRDRGYGWVFIQIDDTITGTQLPDHVSTDSWLSKLAAAAPVPGSILATADRAAFVAIEEFAAFTTAERLQQLWDEGHDVIRAIGIGGQYDGAVVQWRPHRPQSRL